MLSLMLPSAAVLVTVEVVVLGGRKRASWESKSLFEPWREDIWLAKPAEAVELLTSPVRAFNWAVKVLICAFRSELFLYKSQERTPKPTMRRPMTIIIITEAPDFLGVATGVTGEAMGVTGEGEVGLGFMVLGWKILSMGFWAVKEIAAGDADKGRVMGEEEMGAKDSKFIFLDSEGA